MKQGKCQFCSCTTKKACFGGCYWVNRQRNVCSRCYDDYKHVERLKELRRLVQRRHKLSTKENAMSKKKKPRYVYRSAVTGRFVSAAYAKRYPKRTIRQRVK